MLSEPPPTVAFPEKLRCLFEPHRYKVVWGGRAGLKSWSFARALLIQGSEAPQRILCAREIQKSIKDSVHQTLSDQIPLLGLEDFYEIYEQEIRGRNGTTFLFAGLSDQTATSIKSFEGISRVWLEEAQNISKRSFDILIPTIRKEGSEIWISFNPELDTDETYQRFVLKPPSNAVVVKTTYKDNPWLTKESEDDRRHCEITDQEGYQNIWLGEPRVTVAGAIYAKDILLAMQEHRLCRVPYDPRLKVHTVWDLGFNDCTAIGLFQKGFSEFRMIDYLEEHGKKIHEYAAHLNGMHLNWGWDWLPHDGFTEDVKAPSVYRILVQHGRRVKPKVGTKLPIPNVEVEIGIKMLRGLFHRLVIDDVKCARFIECCKRYRRSINNQTHEPGAPLHDQYCLGPDTQVRTLSGWKRIAELVGTTFHVWSYSVEEHRVIPARVVRCWKSQTVDRVARVVLDSGAVITCTPDHRFMLRTEEWKSADQLVPGDRLMPFYEFNSTTHTKIHLNDGSVADEHRYVYARLKGMLKDGYHVHHVDHDKHNNEPSNLDQITIFEHRSIHSSTPEHKAHLKRIGNKNGSPAATRHLIAMNKARGGDQHHTKQPGYWTDTRRRKVGENNSKTYKASERTKECPGCGEIFKANWKRGYCCDNCKATVRRRRKGVPVSRWSPMPKQHCDDCRRVLPVNHRVVAVNYLHARTDVYDMDVEGTHNFIAEGVVVHNSHGADMARYWAFAADKMTNDEERDRIPRTERQRPFDQAMGAL